MWGVVSKEGLQCLVQFPKNTDLRNSPTQLLEHWGISRTELCKLRKFRKLPVFLSPHSMYTLPRHKHTQDLEETHSFSSIRPEARRTYILMFHRRQTNPLAGAAQISTSLFPSNTMVARQVPQCPPEEGVFRGLRSRFSERQRTQRGESFLAL